MQKLHLKQKIDLTIEALGNNGEGIARWHSQLIFVEGALPGEVVECQISAIKHSYAQATLLNIRTPSPARIASICPLFGRCGGCQLMHLEYQEQLIFKQQLVVEAFRKTGKLLDVPISPCLPSPQAVHYRNKAQLPLSQSRGGLKVGLYARNSHEIIEIENCSVQCELGEQVYKQVKLILEQSELSAFDSSSQQGIWRYLIIKTAINTQQVLVVLVTTPISALEKEALDQIAQKIIKNCPNVKGVVQNINGSCGNTILGDSFITLAGQSSVEERICGKLFKVSPASFFQINPRQAELLYAKAIEWAELSGKETVLDAYCGVGTLSLLLSPHAKNVIAIECVSQAIQDAQENARLNSITNVRFVCANSEEFIGSLDDIDVALINPPRRGCESSFLKGIARLKPKALVYISCNPHSLARDLAILKQAGYRIDKVQPYDMFPQTAHVETIVKLSFTV